MNNETPIQDLAFKITRKYQKSPQRMTNIKSIISVNKIYCGKTLTQFDAEVMIRANEKPPFKQPLRQLPKTVKSLINSGTSTSNIRKNQKVTSSGMQTDNTISIQEKDFNYITWGGRLSKILDKERQQVNSGGPSIIERMNYIRNNSPQRFKRTSELKKQIQETSIKLREGLEGSMRLAAEADMPKQQQEAYVEGIDILNENLTCNTLSAYERKKQNLSKITYGDEKNYEREWVEGKKTTTDKNESKNSQQAEADRSLQAQILEQMEQTTDYNNTPDIKIVSAEIMDILDINNTETEEQQNQRQKQSEEKEEVETDACVNVEENQTENQEIAIQQEDNEQKPIQNEDKQEESFGFDNEIETENQQPEQQQDTNQQNLEVDQQNQNEQNKKDDNLFAYQIIKNQASPQVEVEKTNPESSNLDKELNKIVHSTLKLEENALCQDDEDTCLFQLDDNLNMQEKPQSEYDTPQPNSSLFKYVPTQKEIEDHSSQGYVSDIKEETDLTNDSFQVKTRQGAQSQLDNQIDSDGSPLSGPLNKSGVSDQDFD